MNHQIALVTGAASGLGLAIARRLAAEGAWVALLDLFGRPGKMEEMRGEFEGTGEVYALDITKEEDVRGVVERVVRARGRIDILVNSAGITGETNLKSHETRTDNLRLVFEVNFMGSYFTSKYVLPVMVGQGYGRILHIASIAGKEGNAGMVAYSASKAAVIGMAKVQGKEYAGTGVTINALAPAVQTAGADRLRDFLGPDIAPFIDQQMKLSIPLGGKLGDPTDDLGPVLVFLASTGARFITGQLIPVDGGLAMVGG